MTLKVFGKPITFFPIYEVYDVKAKKKVRARRITPFLYFHEEEQRLFFLLPDGFVRQAIEKQRNLEESHHLAIKHKILRGRVVGLSSQTSFTLEDIMKYGEIIYSHFAFLMRVGLSPETAYVVTFMSIRHLIDVFKNVKDLRDFLVAYRAILMYKKWVMKHGSKE